MPQSAIRDSQSAIEMSAAPKAVFLSYASQDAEAARKIADALRGAEVEVWFDQRELRGGDAWDSRLARGFGFGVLSWEIANPPSFTGPSEGRQ